MASIDPVPAPARSLSAADAELVAALNRVAYELRTQNLLRLYESLPAIDAAHSDQRLAATFYTLLRQRLSLSATQDPLHGPLGDAAESLRLSERDF